MGKRKQASREGGASKKRKRGRGFDSDDDGLGDESAAAAVADAVDRDLEAARAQAREAEEARRGDGQDGQEVEEDAAEPDPTSADPYLLADAAYIQKDTRWRNKQRTLVFSSRGVTSRYRHLCEDVRKLLPHHKTEPKFEKKANFQEINEVCELKSCNNVVFFEARRHEDLYLWVSRVPSGPTMKFQVLNVHTTKEVRLAGNCLLGSRPILHFDKAFSQLSFLKVVKGLFTQVFGTPRNHPKSKPFHDHVMSFYWLDKKIWFRHYQVSPETPTDRDDPEKQVLTEIGPRFVLDPIRFLSGSFCGQTLYLNPHYMSPRALRVQASRLLGNPYVKRLQDKADRQEREKEAEFPEDPLDEAFK